MKASVSPEKKSNVIGVRTQENPTEGMGTENSPLIITRIQEIHRPLKKKKSSNEVFSSGKDIIITPDRLKVLLKLKAHSHLMLDKL